MKKRIFGTVLAAILLLAALPVGALAELPAPSLNVSGAGTFVYDETAHTVSATVDNAGTDEYAVTYAVNGGAWSSEAPSKTDVGTYTIEVKAVNQTNTGAAPLTQTVTLTISPKPTLTVTGGTFGYDGNSHSVSASVENGDGYQIEYSTDGGSTWLLTAPSYTEVGKYTVQVKATKGADTLTGSAVIEIKAVLKATGVKVELDGKEHTVSAEVLGATGYTIEYSTDGTSWSATAPKRSTIGKTTVKVRAIKSGAETLTADDVAIEIVSGPSLIVESGKFPYDGKEHAVVARVEGGEGYTIEFSTDGGTTWTTTAPSRKEIGVTTVKVHAIKSGAETLSVADVTLEVFLGKYETAKIVNCNTAVNVRKSASSASKLLGTAKKGNVYVLLGKEGKWYKIQYTDTLIGYVHKDYVKTGEATVTPEPTADDQIVTIVNCHTDCNVRAGGSTGYAKIGTAALNKQYKYLGKSGSYYKIQYTATTVGYVHQKYAKVSGGTASTDPEPSIEGKIVTIYNCNTDCNVRAGGSKSTKLIGIAPRSKTYTYLGTSGDYVKIQYREKTVGYVHKSYAKVSEGTAKTDPEPTNDGKTGTIYNCKTMVNVRESATSSSKLLGTLKKGVTVEVLGTSGNWTKIRYGTGTAYVFTKYVKVG